MGVIAAAITFMFLNLDALYRPVANCSLVPQGDSHDLQEQPFVATFREAKAAAQTAGSFSSPWRGP